MEYCIFGDLGIEVSLIGFGMMMWGEQNLECDVYEQIDYVFGQGVMLIDVVEMYLVLLKFDMQGCIE